jgi:hypothetical protein
MLIAEGGGGYGGTDWTSQDVIQMWQAIENQDTTAHYQMLTGWQRSYELTLEHLGQVKNYRDNLVAAWPPEKSAASAAYVQRLDELIASLQATYDSAVANHSAFASATLALSLSRNDVKKIYDEYTGNQTKLVEFENRPKPVTKYVAPQKPPVPDGRQEELNNQARSIMYGLSSEIIQATAQISKPPVYDPTRIRESNDKDNGGVTYIPPSIPTVGTFEPSSGAAHPGSASAPQHPPKSTSTPSGTGPVNVPPDAVRQPGLVLGGAQPTPVAPPSAGLSQMLPTGGGGQTSNLISSPPLVPTVPGGSAPTRLPQGNGAMKGFVGETPGRTGVGRPPIGIHAMAPGGIIGRSPSVGAGQSPNGRSLSRVNPVGGVIEPGGGPGRVGSTGRGVSPSQTVGNLGGRRPDAHDESNDLPPWDPDNPWETAEGVSPVVLPATEPRIDPGPAIGLR